MKKAEIRAYIKFRHGLGIKPPLIHAELVDIMGTTSPCLRTVYTWCERFSLQDESIEDRIRAGRPVSVTSAAEVERVNSIITEDPHISFTDLEALTKISRKSLQRIINDQLKLRKVSSRWIPHEVIDLQKPESDNNNNNNNDP